MNLTLKSGLPASGPKNRRNVRKRSVNGKHLDWKHNKHLQKALTLKHLPLWVSQGSGLPNKVDWLNHGHLNYICKCFFFPLQLYNYNRQHNQQRKQITETTFGSKCALRCREKDHGYSTLEGKITPSLRTRMMGTRIVSSSSGGEQPKTSGHRTSTKGEG